MRRRLTKASTSRSRPMKRSVSSRPNAARPGNGQRSSPVIGPVGSAALDRPAPPTASHRASSSCSNASGKAIMRAPRRPCPSTRNSAAGAPGVGGWCCTNGASASTDTPRGVERARARSGAARGTRGPRRVGRSPRRPPSTARRRRRWARPAGSRSKNASSPSRRRDQGERAIDQLAHLRVAGRGVVGVRARTARRAPRRAPRRAARSARAPDTPPGSPRTAPRARRRARASRHPAWSGAATGAGSSATPASASPRRPAPTWAWAASAITPTRRTATRTSCHIASRAWCGWRAASSAATAWASGCGAPASAATRILRSSSRRGTRLGSSTTPLAARNAAASSSTLANRSSARLASARARTSVERDRQLPAERRQGGAGVGRGQRDPRRAGERRAAGERLEAEHAQRVDDRCARRPRRGRSTARAPCTAASPSPRRPRSADRSCARRAARRRWRRRAARPAARSATSSAASPSLAMPRSSSLGRSRPARDSTMMLPGLRSRWTMPCSCAVWITSHRRSSSGTNRSSAIGPVAASSRSSGVPRTSSIAIHSTPSGSAPNA